MGCFFSLPTPLDDAPDPYTLRRERALRASPRVRASPPAVTPPPTAASLPLISRAELSKHRSRTSAWVAVRGRVYDVTAFLPRHPGGINSLLQSCGGDGTAAFSSAHSWVQLHTALPAGALMGSFEK